MSALILGAAYQLLALPVSGHAIIGTKLAAVSTIITKTTGASFRRASYLLPPYIVNTPYL